MNQLAKWAWLILLSILFLGYWTFVILGIDVIAFLLVLWLKPEWIDRI